VFLRSSRTILALRESATKDLRPIDAIADSEVSLSFVKVPRSRECDDEKQLRSQRLRFRNRNLCDHSRNLRDSSPRAELACINKISRIESAIVVKRETRTRRRDCLALYASADRRIVCILRSCHISLLSAWKIAEKLIKLQSYDHSDLHLCSSRRSVAIVEARVLASRREILRGRRSRFA